MYSCCFKCICSILRGNLKFFILFCLSLLVLRETLSRKNEVLHGILKRYCITHIIYLYHAYIFVDIQFVNRQNKRKVYELSPTSLCKLFQIYPLNMMQIPWNLMLLCFFVWCIIISLLWLNGSIQLNLMSYYDYLIYWSKSIESVTSLTKIKIILSTHIHL